VKAITERLQKLFYGTPMTWRRVIGFALATAVLTAGVLLIPALNNTSFQNIGVTFECWILFALIVILNCEKPTEAGLKVFVFFLISQPLIYLLQVPFSSAGWQIFRYYPRWFVLTVLCLPGGMLAWYVKKGGVRGALILSMATGILSVECIGFAEYCVDSFPQFLLSILFCALLAVLLIFALLKERRQRIIAGAITLLAALAALIYIILV